MEMTSPTFTQVVAFYGDPLPFEKAGRGYMETIIIAKIAALQSLLSDHSAIRWSGKSEATTKKATKAKAVTKRVEKMGAEKFWRLYGDAVARCTSEHGANWKCSAPIGRTVLVSLPACYRSYRGPLGTMIKYRRDHRVPAAQFWAGGLLPDGLVIVAEASRETAKRAWADGRQTDNRGYAEWQRRWAAQNGLTFRSGVWLTAAQLAARG
jgi:hypothetical protein